MWGFEQASNINIAGPRDKPRDLILGNQAPSTPWLRTLLCAIHHAPLPPSHVYPVCPGIEPDYAALSMFSLVSNQLSSNTWGLAIITQLWWSWGNFSDLQCLQVAPPVSQASFRLLLPNIKLRQSKNEWDLDDFDVKYNNSWWVCGLIKSTRCSRKSDGNLCLPYFAWDREALITTRHR